MGSVLRVLLSHFEEGVGVALLVALGAIVLLQIVSRDILGIPVKWTEELSRVLIAWLTFVGASAVAKINGHPRVTLLRSSAARFWLDVFADVCSAVLLLYGAYYGFLLATKLTSIKLVTMNASWAWWYSAFPVGAGLMLIRILERQSWLGRKESQKRLDRAGTRASRSKPEGERV